MPFLHNLHVVCNTLFFAISCLKLQLVMFFIRDISQHMLSTMHFSLCKIMMTIEFSSMMLSFMKILVS